MGNYFGTDGIRGVVNEDLTTDVAYKCGNALSHIKKQPVCLIGCDTRRSGDMLKLSLAAGITASGGHAIDSGIVPTAAVAYLTRFYKADFGIVISASHNTKEFNGIKIFSSDGYKLSEVQEKKIESYFNFQSLEKPDKVGSFKIDQTGKKFYENYLKSTAETRLDGLKIVLDCANGAASEVAPEVFSHLGAQVISINTDILNNKINENCGAMHLGELRKKVKEEQAVAGFAYDGDADRLICCDENGEVVDGDKLLYIFAKEYKKQNKLDNMGVVGTSHTNMGIENKLEASGISLQRSDIGDKYVMQLMRKSNMVLGGEQSGHIIFSNLSTTGDGILSSIQLARLLLKDKLSNLANVELYNQVNVNIVVKDKVRVLGSEHLAAAIEKARQEMGHEGRLNVRASGTEPIVRAFAESKNHRLALSCAKQIEQAIRQIEND